MTSNGKMANKMQRYSHLDEKTNRVMELTAEERIEHLDKPFTLMYPKLSNLMQLLSHYLGIPKKTRMPNLLIIGDSNNGKTTAIREFCEEYPKAMYEDDEGISRVRRPVLSMQAPHVADEKSFYIAILEEFWTSFRPNDTMAKLRHQALYLMREQGVKMLIVDEIHNILETTAVKQRQIMNMIKNIGNELQISIVGAGTETALSVLQTDPQHASRFDVVRLPLWKPSNEFRGLLLAFEHILPLEKPSGLAQKKKASRLYTISKGNIGNLHKLLIICSKYAIENGDEEITFETIERFKWVCPTDKNQPITIEL